jgi:Sec-independent protein translocase protein TatA
MGLGEIIFIVIILSLIFGAGRIFGSAGWVRKGILVLRKEWDAGKESSIR